MEPRFQIEQVYTKEFYSDYAWLCQRKIRNYKSAITILVEIPLIVALWLGFISKAYPYAIAFVIAAAILPLWYKSTFEKQIDRAWESNKMTQNMHMKIDFYDTYVEVTSERSDAKYDYDLLYVVVESENMLGLMVGNNQGVSMYKEKCSTELLAFLKEKTNGKVKWI